MIQILYTKAAGSFNNFTEFCSCFKKHFGDSDVVSTAHTRLISLTQDQCGLCTAYYARYRELLPFVDWSEQSKIVAFYEHLKSHVKDKLARILTKPKVFHEYAKICIELDNLAYQ